MFERYALYPGMGKVNGQYEYVNAAKLAQLYGVNGHYCTVIKVGQKNEIRGTFTLLRPRDDGRYIVAEAPKIYWW